MRQIRIVQLLALIAVFVGISAFTFFDNEPKLTSQELVHEMIDAHGGMHAWKSSAAVKFTHVAHMPSMPGQLDWMISHEVFDQNNRKAYADFPFWNARIGNDGEQVWSENWPFPNPPSMMLGIHYYMGFLPWLSQDDGVAFGEQMKGKVTGDETEYILVPFWYETKDTGQKPDVWTFYIHPETREMAAYSVQFGPGKAVHAIDGYLEIDGLKVPSDWTTYAGPQQDKVIGHHIMYDVDFDHKFNSTKLKKPIGAVVDE